MSSSNSDSEGSATGWTVVNNHGEVESSDDGSSSGSSLEFVHLEDSGATYQRRQRSDSNQDTQEQPLESEAPKQEKLGEEAHQRKHPVLENLGPLDDANSESKTVTPELPSPSPSPSDEENGDDTGIDEDEDEAEEHSPPEGAPEGDPQQWNPDDADSDSSAEVLHKDELMQPDEDGRLLLGAEATAAPPVDHLHQGPPLPRHVSESDSDSDFVQLDPGHQAEAGGEDLSPEDCQGLDVSVSSQASSSFSTNFRFVHPALAQGFHVYREEEEESVPGDFDDRCESDISGVATDDSDIDLSNMTYGIADVPLTAGTRLYYHRPNRSLNSILTIISLITLFLAVGIGIGHYLGSSRWMWLRQMQVAKMKSLQDDYLMCLKQQDHLEQRIDILSPPSKVDSVVLSTDQFNRISRMWQERYEDLNRQKMELEARIQNIQVAGDQHKQQMEGEKVVLEAKVANLMVTEQMAQQALADQQLENRQLHQQEQALQSDLENLNVENKGLKMEMDVMVQDKEQILVDQDIISKDLVELKSKMNQIQTENTDLRSEVMRLRYTAHPGNTEVNPVVAQQQLKVKVNQLANENEDLKSTVGKMRYTKPIVEDAKTEDSEATPKDNFEAPPVAKEGELLVLKQQLAAVTDELEAQQRRNYLWQSMFISDHVEKPTPNASPEDSSDQENYTIGSFLSCMRHVVPGMVANLSAPFLQNASGAVQQQWAFLKNVSSDNVVMETLQQKWGQLVNYTGSTEFQEVKKEALEIQRDIQDMLIEKWHSFTNLTSKVIGSGNADGAQSKPTTPKYKQMIKNLTRPMAGHFQDYMNKTKETVSKLSVKLHDTWEKVKNLSANLLKKHENTIKTVEEKVKTKLKDVGNSVRSKWQNLKEKIGQRKHASKPGKKQHRKKHERKAKHYKQKQDHSQYAHTKRRGHGENTMPNDPPRPFEDKAHHKQRQSNHEQYDEFWRRTDFDPEGLLQEGFFEGNQREWRKHQKRLHRLHGRIHRLNEDILYSMDDDDIEDIYDDLEDFQDDLEDEDQPQLLQTWLACQVRWWKSRFQRKHRSEDLIKGCGMQIMHWQLRALCKDECYSRKCLKKWRSIRAHPFCHDILHPTAGTQSQADDHIQSAGQHSKCQKCFHTQPQGSPKTAKDIDAAGLAKPATRQVSPTRASKIEDKDSLFQMEVAAADEKDVNDTLFSSDVDPSWYFKRAEERELHHHDPKWYTLALDTKGMDEDNRKEGRDVEEEKNPSWYFQYGSMREDHRHSPEWVFGRANEREFERTKSWYIRRIEERARRYDQQTSSDSSAWGQD